MGRAMAPAPDRDELEALLDGELPQDLGGWAREQDRLGLRADGGGSARQRRSSITVLLGGSCGARNVEVDDGGQRQPADPARVEPGRGRERNLGLAGAVDPNEDVDGALAREPGGQRANTPGRPCLRAETASGSASGPKAIARTSQANGACPRRLMTSAADTPSRAQISATTRKSCVPVMAPP